MLALPWRRFDQDLGGGDGEGFQICGRRIVIEDVSNSSEGTGLFTWVSERGGGRQTTRTTTERQTDRQAIKYRYRGYVVLVQRALLDKGRARVHRSKLYSSTVHVSRRSCATVVVQCETSTQRRLGFH